MRVGDIPVGHVFIGHGGEGGPCMRISAGCAHAKLLAAVERPTDHVGYVVLDSGEINSRSPSDQVIPANDLYELVKTG